MCTTSKGVVSVSPFGHLEAPDPQNEEASVPKGAPLAGIRYFTWYVSTQEAPLKLYSGCQSKRSLKHKNFLSLHTKSIFFYCLRYNSQLAC